MEAVQMEAEQVGSIDPAGMDRDPVRHLDTIFTITD